MTCVCRVGGVGGVKFDFHTDHDVARPERRERHRREGEAQALQAQGHAREPGQQHAPGMARYCRRHGTCQQPLTYTYLGVQRMELRQEREMRLRIEPPRGHLLGDDRVGAAQ